LAAVGTAGRRQAVKGGRFFPEENPEDIAALVKKFLSA
jgi:hypothetical protein